MKNEKVNNYLRLRSKRSKRMKRSKRDRQMEEGEIERLIKERR